MNINTITVVWIPIVNTIVHLNPYYCSGPRLLDLYYTRIGTYIINVINSLICLFQLGAVGGAFLHEKYTVGQMLRLVFEYCRLRIKGETTATLFEYFKESDA